MSKNFPIVIYAQNTAIFKRGHPSSMVPYSMRHTHSQDEGVNITPKARWSCASLSSEQTTKSINKRTQQGK